jgi:hypothetical protein
MNYERDMNIDETALDVEWLEQADLALKYGKIWADRKKVLTEAEEKVKVIRAELIAEANADPEGCCNKKSPNAADIEAYYRMSERHKKAKTAWIEAEYECNMAEIAKNEVSFTRKAALEQLVTLFMGNYFAGPKVPRNLIEERKEGQERDKRVNADISSKLRRRL